MKPRMFAAVCAGVVALTAGCSVSGSASPPPQRPTPAQLARRIEARPLHVVGWSVHGVRCRRPSHGFLWCWGVLREVGDNQAATVTHHRVPIVFHVTARGWLGSAVCLHGPGEQNPFC